MVHRHQNLLVTHPADYRRSFAILHRFHRVRRDQLAGGLRDPGEVAVHQFQQLGFIYLSRNCQHRVVRLVVLAVELLQLLNRYSFHVALVADHRTPVAVSGVGRSHRPLQCHPHGAVLTHLELVPHNGEFFVQIFFLNEGVHHPVRFEVQSPLQILVGRLEGLEVVGAIPRRCPVRARAVFGQFLRDIRVLRAALEHHVLQEMCHAALAGTFVP